MAADEMGEVWETDDPTVTAVFEGIPAAAGVAGVHGLWRRLAKHPRFLSLTWPALEQDLQSAEIEMAASALREASFITEAVGMPSHKAFRGDLVRAEIDADFRAQIERFNDASQFGLSRLLLIAAGLRRGTKGSGGGTKLQRATDRSVFLSFSVPPLRRGKAGGKAAELVDRIGQEHALPFLDDYYLSIAHAAEYLSAAWNAISPLVGDPLYIERSQQLTRLADERASSLTSPNAARDAIKRVPPETASEIRQLLDQFVGLVLPQTLIDVTLIKALTSGPERATILSAPN